MIRSPFAIVIDKFDLELRYERYELVQTQARQLFSHHLYFNNQYDKIRWSFKIRICVNLFLYYLSALLAFQIHSFIRIGYYISMLNIGCLLLLAASVLALKGDKPTVTIITGFWDIGRGQLDGNFKRSKDFYLEYFEAHIQTPSNMIIFGDESLKKFVSEKRKHPNTVFILTDLDDVRKRWYTPKVHKIINKFKTLPVWKDYKRYPQYGLEMYNPVIMSKLFFMTEAIEHDIFDSDYFSWADAGLIHNYGMNQGANFAKKRSFEHAHYFYQDTWYFHTYKDRSIFRGYQKSQLRYLPEKVPYNQVVLANYFGGRIQVVSTIKSIYQNFLRITLDYGDLGTEESVFSMMMVRFPYIIPLVSDYDAKDLSLAQNFRSPLYLSFTQHRIFTLRANGAYQYEELNVKKDRARTIYRVYNETVTIIKPEELVQTGEKVSLDSTDRSQQEQVLEFDYSSFEMIPKTVLQDLSLTLKNYKVLLIHRALFCLLIFLISYHFTHLTQSIIDGID